MNIDKYSITKVASNLDALLKKTLIFHSIQVYSVIR